MKTPLVISVICLLFCGCKTTEPLSQHHTPSTTAPSVEPVKRSISDAREQVTAMRRGNDRIEGKAIRALEVFPRP